MAESKHTPGPWRTTKMGASIYAPSEGVRGDERERVVCWLSGSAPPAERKATADFIVRACNAHDDLLALLGEQGEAMNRCPSNDLNYAGRSWEMRARALLARLDGKEAG
jgi:hypothetical protein